jgi:hypothetical protein
MNFLTFEYGKVLLDSLPLLPVYYSLRELVGIHDITSRSRCHKFVKHRDEGPRVLTSLKDTQGLHDNIYP